MKPEKLSLEKIDHLKQRQNDITVCLNALRDISFGFHTKMDPLFLTRRQLNLDAIHDTAMEIAALTGCADEEFHFYESFYSACIFYLYSECNADDRIFVSLVKLASTLYKDGPEANFDDTTFGIMIQMSTETQHRGMDSVAHLYLMSEVSSLKHCYDALPSLSNLDTVTHTAVREYLLTHGLAPSTSDALHSKLLETLHHTRWDLLAMQADA